MQAVKIKEHHLDPLKSSGAVNAFQWSKARLALDKPEALATVQRFEADSKFFRSLLIVLCILFLWALVQERLALALVIVPMLGLSFWRYVDQRVKSTNQAYWYIITLESQRENGYRHSSQGPASGPSHAGGVVFKKVGQEVQYLLVQAKSAPHEWVLPKGHIECGERMQETAVREVKEETGVWARIKKDLRDITFSVEGKEIKVQFYLMEAVKEEIPVDVMRKRLWLPFDQGLRKAAHKESQELLRIGEQERVDEEKRIAEQKRKGT